MSGSFRRFDPSELGSAGEGGPPTAESAEALEVARELDALASSDGIRPSAGFEDRVMTAIASEPAPRVVMRPGSTVRGGRPAAFFLAVRDAWGVATTGGRPLAIRAQAIAFVLVLVVAAGSLAAVGAATVGGLLNGSSGPAPSFEPPPTAVPSQNIPATPSTSPQPSDTAQPSVSPDPIETAEPTSTPDPGTTARPTPTGNGTETPEPGETARPPRTPKPTETPEPTDTPEPSDDHGGGGGPGRGGPGPG